MTRGRWVRAARGVLPAAAALWAVLLVSAPWLGGPGAGLGVGARVAAATYLVGSLVCHQRPLRSFHLAGAQLPVCGRCTGLYVSAGAGATAAWIAGRRRRRRWSGARWARWRVWLIGSALPTLASVGGEAAGWWAGSNAGRAAAGIPLGFAVGVLLAEFRSFEVD